MKRVRALVLVISFACALLPYVGSAQTKEDGIRLYKEANALLSKARTPKDLSKALTKYEAAIGVFQKGGDTKGLGVATRKAGIVLDRLGQHDKAVEYYEKALAISREAKDRKGL